MSLKILWVDYSFGKVKVLENVTLEFPMHQITWIIGKNGSGKSTLINIICGNYKNHIGQIIFNDANITTYSLYQTAKIGIARVFQRPRLFEDLTVLDNLYISADIKGDSFFHLLKRKKDKAVMEKIDTYAKEFKIDHILSERCSDTSFGQKRLVEIARALICEPQILILDEPVAGVLQETRDIIAEKLISLKSEKTHIIVIEHDIDFIKNIVDKIIVLDLWKVVFEWTREDVQRSSEFLQYYLWEC